MLRPNLCFPGYVGLEVWLIDIMVVQLTEVELDLLHKGEGPTW